MCRAGICYLCYIDQNAWRPGQGGRGRGGMEGVKVQERCRDLFMHLKFAVQGLFGIILD